MPPQSKSTVNEIQRKFGEVAVDAQKYKRRGEVVYLVGRVDSRTGKEAARMRTLDNTLWGTKK